MPALGHSGCAALLSPFIASIRAGSIHLFRGALARPTFLAAAVACVLLLYPSSPSRALFQTTVEDKPQQAQSSAEERLQQTENQERQLEPEEALRRYEDLLREFEARKQLLGRGRAELGLARLAMRQGDSVKAEELARGALDILRRAKDVRFEAMAHFELANVLVARGSPEEARGHYQAALPGFRQVKDSFQEGRTFNGIGNVYFLTGFYEKAWENYKASYAIARDTKNDVLLSRSLNNLGGLAEATGRYAEAIEFHQQSLQLKLQAKDEIGVARSNNGLGNVYFRLGSYSKALGYYKAAADIFQSKAPAETAFVLNNIGTTLKNLERYEEALEYLQKAYEAGANHKRPLEMVVPLNNQGYVYSLQGRYEESLAKHQEALNLAREIPSPEDELHALHGIANNQFRLGRYAEALDTFRRVVSLADKLKSPDESAGGHNGMGRSYEKLGQRDHALTEYRSSVDIIESARAQVQLDVEKAEYLENNLEAYTNIVYLLAGQAGPSVPASSLAEAFSFAERWRARALLELLAESRRRIAPRVDPALASEQERLLAELSTIQGQIRELMAEAKSPSEKLRALWQESDGLYDAYKMLQRRVRLQDPNYASLESPEPVSLSELQQTLPPDGILLEYAFDHRRNLLGLPRVPWGLCFAITRESTRVFAIESVSQIPELAVRLREALVRPAGLDPRRNLMAREFTDTAHELYRLLVAPAGPLLSGKRRMVVVPDGSLTLTPFEVLLTAANSSPPSSSAGSALPYLVRRFAVSYAPSATIYSRIRTKAETSTAPHKDLLVLADPNYEGERPQAEPLLELLAASASQSGFRRLPYSAQEAKAVAKLFSPTRRDVLLREEASEDRFRQAVAANTYSYILFSVHGIASERYPQFSSLVLTRSPGSPHDGMLQAHEIYNLRLPSDLVVLSACETALGKDVQGEGLLGLARAFLYAGARSVVASLWRVEDKSTSEFMAAFFREVKRRPRSLSTAMQKAKLEMLKRPEYAHPFFWAPFTLSGNPQSLNGGPEAEREFHEPRR
jgi:CHAT domain-containing protein/Flp pilus assembly protein TadD